MPQIIGRATKTSANTYASVFGGALLTRSDDQHNFVIHYVENNVNAVTLKFLGSNDGVNFEQLGEETAVAKAGHDYETLSESWLYIDVQVKSTVAATHGSVTVLLTQG